MLMANVPLLLVVARFAPVKLLAFTALYLAPGLLVSTAIFSSRLLYFLNTLVVFHVVLGVAE
jgi:hypothetical protein